MPGVCGVVLVQGWPLVALAVSHMEAVGVSGRA